MYLKCPMWSFLYNICHSKDTNGGIVKLDSDIVYGYNVAFPFESTRGYPFGPKQHSACTLSTPRVPRINYCANKRANFTTNPTPLRPFAFSFSTGVVGGSCLHPFCILTDRKRPANPYNPHISRGSLPLPVDREIVPF